MTQRNKFFCDAQERGTEIVRSSKERKSLKTEINIELPKEIDQKRKKRIKESPKIFFPKKVKKESQTYQ